MELVFKNKTIQLDGSPSVEEIIEKINELLADNFYFSHLVADGREIYEEPENYLTEHLIDISKLEVVAKAGREFVNDVLITAEDYLRRSTPEMTALADGFYQNPSTDNWTNFSHMLEGMQWLNQMISLIDKSKERPGSWDECLKLAGRLEIEVKNLEEAVENMDSVLIADLIQYELLPIYETLGSEMKTIIDTEGYRHDLN